MADARRRTTPFKGLTMPLPGVTPPHTPPLPDDEATQPSAFPDPLLTRSDEHPHARAPRDEDSGIELVVIREDATPKHARQTWRAVEVWTKNRVYGMDASLVCFEVLDRATGRHDTAHPMLGGKLGGGRKRSGKGATFTHPLPIPGTEAMFLRSKKQGFTSIVERVVVRLRVLRVRSVASWEQLVERAAEHDD